MGQAHPWTSTAGPPIGRKVWNTIYRANGKPRWLRIGDASTIGLSDARVLAAETALAVAKGADPAAERRAQRSAGTFGELAAKYVELYAKKKNKSWKQGAYLVERFATERWRNLPAASIQRSDVTAMIAKLKPVLANQVLAAVSAVFSWGIREEIVTVNPCKLVERNTTKSRERILSDSEIPTFWAAFDDIDPITAAAFRAILLTGQRPGEVSNMRFEHLKDGFWELPGAPSNVWPGTKNANSHRVPLSAPVRALIDVLLGEKWPESGYVFGRKSGRPVSELDASMRDLIAKLGIELVTPHDLRRTFASTVAALGFGRQAIDRILNHADRSIAGVYDRHTYAKEDTVIVEAVAAKITALVEGRDAKVLQFKK